jgi:hypothetical protein
MCLRGLLVVTVASLLVRAVPSAHAQSSWDRYKPGSLNAIISRHVGSIDTTRGDIPAFVVSAQTFPTRTTLVFGGQVRPIPPDDLRVLVMWARSAQVDTNRVKEYQEEWLFLEDTVAHWLPVQPGTAASMRSVVSSGDSVQVWVQWFGAITRARRTTWVFPVMQAESSQR